MPCLMPLWKRKGVSFLRAFTDIANHLKLKQDFQNQHVNPRNTPSISVSKATQLSWSSVTSSGNAVILPFALVLPCSSIPPALKSSCLHETPLHSMVVGEELAWKPMGSLSGRECTGFHPFHQQRMLLPLGIQENSQSPRADLPSFAHSSVQGLEWRSP